MNYEEKIHLIEIGTEYLKFLTIQNTKIIAKVTFENYGLKDGYIADSETFLKNFQLALKKYQHHIKDEIEEVILLINPISLEYSIEKIIHNVINQRYIEETDLDEIERKADNLFFKTKNNREFLEKIDISFNINNYSYFSKNLLAGLETKKIEAKIGYLSILKNHLKIFISSLGIDVLEVYFPPCKVLDKLIDPKTKELGLIFLNIGDKISNLILVENGKCVYLKQLKIGKIDILNQFAIKNNFKLSKAEKEFKKNEDSKEIEKYFQELFDIIKNELIKYNKNYQILFTSGILILSDNFFKQSLLEDKIKDEFKLLLNDSLKNKKVSDLQFDYTGLYASGLFFLENKKEGFSFKKLFRKIFNRK